MLKKLLTSATALCLFFVANAQVDSVKKGALTITGSVDAYYRFDFAGKMNNKTSFTNSVNSFELGMASLRADHTVGKVTATADLGFGRRAAEFSYNDAGSLALIKQLYLTFNASDKVKFSLGKFTTHIGYELLDAVANRNYSMSYGFSYGPFFHTGVKADFSLGGKTAMMLGVANPTDLTTSNSGKFFAIGQLSTATKNDKLKAYLNFQTGTGTDVGNTKITQLDWVFLGTLSSKFSINYNGTIQYRKPEGGTSSSWSSNALYFTYDPTQLFGLTLRTELLSDKDDLLAIGAKNLFVPTLSANFRVNNLTFIPEIRLDNAKENVFEKSDGSFTKGATQFLIAATYKF
jgi:hypothetical protein